MGHEQLKAPLREAWLGAAFPGEARVDLNMGVPDGNCVSIIEL
jgi:hypothetical protein